MFPDSRCVLDWTETWTKGLSDLTLEQIGQGVAALLKVHPTFAPTLGEFRECAKPKTDPAHVKYLPPPRVAANVSAHMEKVKVALNPKPSDWWKQANALTVQILERSSDPDAHKFLALIAEHSPALFERREPWWAK